MTARALPRSLEDLRGRRAARWIRESTAGQADNFGPDAQLEQQTRAIERWGLVDTGGAWQVAHSGRTIAATGPVGRDARRRRRGLGRPRRRLRVPLRPGPADRRQRPPRPPRPGRRDPVRRRAGPLARTRTSGSAGPGRRSRPRRTAAGSRSGSGRATPRSAGGSASRAATRRRSGRSGEGRTIARRRGSAGARPPRLRARGRRAGPTARSGAATGLALKHVAEILTNPFYVGRLWSGEPSALGAARRPWDLGARPGAAGRGTAGRHRGAVNRRQYGLGGLLACAGLRPPAHRARRAVPPPGRLRGVHGGRPAPGPARRRDDRPAGAGRVVQGRRVRGRDRPRLRARRRLVDAQGQHRGDRRRRPEPDGATTWRGPGSSRERERAALRFAKDRDLGQPRGDDGPPRRRGRSGGGPAVTPARPPPRRAPTSSRCRTCGRRRRTPGARRSPRPCSSGSTSWG